jgi:hypothetical protein
VQQHQIAALADDLHIQPRRTHSMVLLFLCTDANG